MTGDEMIQRLRDQIKDDPADPRWPSGTTVLRYMQDIIVAIAKDNPEALHVGDEIVTSYPSYTDTALELPITVPFQNRLLHLLAARILTEDREEAGNAVLGDYHINRAGAE